MDPRYFSDDDFGRIICEAFHAHRDMDAVNWNAVARTVRAQLKAETWLPMSTAPKDGTVVLMCGTWLPYRSMPGGEPTIYLASWMVHPGDNGEWWTNPPTARLKLMGARWTHWMPVPVPPEAQKP